MPNILYNFAYMKRSYKKYALNKKQFRYFITGVAALLIAMIPVVLLLYRMRANQDREYAIARGESIVSNILVELRRCLDTTELLNDMYSASDGLSLLSFSPLCAELQKDNLVIGSMYWAPNGVIEYSYPNAVDEATRHFEMLKDPVQGPKAQVAVDSHKATIAGPHSLLEGGRGFIIRNPNYDEAGNFTAFSIMVIDCDEFLHRVMETLDAEDQGYRFAVWKDSDPTAVVDDSGYIFTSHGPIADRKIVIPFKAPNDNWYLTLEPIGGWATFSHMIPSLLVCFALLVFVVLCMYVFFITEQLRQEVRDAEKEAEHMKVLEEAREAAENANQAKTSFLFHMSHDIRTPMNAIIGFTNLLRKYQDIPEKRENYLDKIESSSGVLLSIINNVLEMARIEKGTIEVDEMVWSAEQFYDTLISVFEEMMKQKGLTFTYEINVQNHYVYCDPTKLREVFINILSNAYKYTNSGGSVRLLLDELPSEREGYVVYRTTISDTGMGMSEDFLPHLFDEFSREHNTTENKIEGTGLGMPIVKRLVELMQGAIEVQSQKGVGSTFVVTLPHRIAQREGLVVHAGVEVDPKLFNGKRILLAEDNELNAEIAMEILGEAGFIIEHAENGQMVVDMLRKAPSNYYNVILMDIQMPIMNGYDAARAIRVLTDNAKANIPILAMTANAFEEDKREALRCGMNGHLSKPINVPELMKTLAGIL